MDNFDPNLTVKYLDCKLRDYNQRMFISVELLNRRDVNSFFDRLALDIRHTYLSVPGEKSYSYEHPATWWDMFKEQHMPTWFKNKYPVKFTRIVVDAEAIFPEQQIEDLNAVRELGRKEFRILYTDKLIIE